MEESLEVAIGEETTEREVAGRPFWRERAVIGHLRHMVAAHRHVKPQFAIGAHQGELIRIALVMEKLGEILLRPLHIAHVDEGDTLAEMVSRICKCVDRINRIYEIIFNAETQRLRGICIFYL